MNTNFINLTTENLPAEHLCCIIRSKKPHPGVEAKRQWLSDRLKEGHVFRKLNEKAVVFIEYAPLETAWVPITGYNYYYILPVGHGCPQRKRLRQITDGILHSRRQSKRKVRHLHARLQKTKSLAFRPGICQKVRL